MQFIQVVDSVEYVQENCYQHQLLIDLKRRYNHAIVPLTQLETLQSIDNDVVVLSTVKIRNVYANLPRFKAIFGTRKIFIYDQDPWESFIDIATYPRGYYSVVDAMSNAEFIVTSGWWADFINTQGLKAHFCRIWVLPDYCRIPNQFQNRNTTLAFRGLVHTFRKTAIDNIQKLGRSVTVLPAATRYSEWLGWLQQQRYFFNPEPSDGWLINGKMTPRNCGGPKNVEIVSQGCFALCDASADGELQNYQIDNVPCMLTYKSLEHCVELVRQVDALSITQANVMIEQSVAAIKQVNGWVDMRRILSIN